MRTLINSLYLIIAFGSAILVPLFLILGQIAHNNPTEGIIVGLMSFILMISYIIYTMVLGNRS